MKYRAAFLGAISACLAVAGCSPENTLLYGTYYMSYSPNVPRIAQKDGPVPVAMTGAPFAPSEIVAAMNAQKNIYQMEFATDGKPGPNGYRVALVFDSNVTNPCLSDQTGSYAWPKEQGTVHVAAAFCRYGGMISRTTGRFPQPASPNDPAFRQFMSDVMTELLPILEPDRIGGNGCGRPINSC
ncbi:MAG: hypothetical protein GC202_03345 [Alphaproteobacteria bacterium]|nr:hypothetical protein [Alphaproteobacteria bacterium]